MFSNLTGLYASNIIQLHRYENSMQTVLQMPRCLSSASFWAKSLTVSFVWYDFWRNLEAYFLKQVEVFHRKVAGFLWFSKLQMKEIPGNHGVFDVKKSINNKWRWRLTVSWPGESHAFTSEARSGRGGESGGFLLAAHVFFRVNQPFMWEGGWVVTLITLSTCAAEFCWWQMLWEDTSHLRWKLEKKMEEIKIPWKLIEPLKNDDWKTILSFWNGPFSVRGHVNCQGV